MIALTNPWAVGICALAVPLGLLALIVGWALTTDGTWADPPNAPDELEGPT